MEGNALGASAMFAILLLPFVSLIKKPTWGFEAKYALGMAASMVAAFGGAVVDGNVHTAAEAVAYFGTAFTASQTIYNLYFGKTEMNDKLENVGA